MIAAEFYRLALTMRRQNVAYIESRLASIPNVKFGTKEKNGKRIKVVRYYEVKDGKYIAHEHKLSSAAAQRLLSKMEEKDALRIRRDKLTYRKELEQKTISEAAVPQPMPSPYNRQAFDKLVERNDPDIPKNNPYNGRFFRSKSEVMIAQYLDELGLEYKYEVKIVINDEVFYIDFAVYCPETGRFFFIEHFGRMESESYSMRAIYKTVTYLNSGMKEGYDIIYTYENVHGGINIDVVKMKILCVLATHVTAHL